MDAWMDVRICLKGQAQAQEAGERDVTDSDAVWLDPEVSQDEAGSTASVDEA